MLAAAVGATALFSAVIAVNVQLAHHRLHEATHSAARLGGLVEEVSDLHEQLTGVMFKAVSLGDRSAEADYRRIRGSIDDILQSFDSTPGREPVPGGLSVILRAHDRLKASESQVFRWLDAGYPDSALAALLAPQHTRADHDFHGTVHQTALQLTAFRAELANRFTRHLLIIARVTAVLVLMLTAVWIVIVLMMRRFYQAHTQAETALRESENRYRVLVENLPQKIFLKDRNSVYISCNKGYARDVKVKPWEIAGKTDYEFFPKELAEKYRADDKRIIESGEAEEIEEQYVQDGKEVFVHTAKTPVRDEHGHVSGLLGIFWDITERKNAQEKLKRAEERYRAIFENAVIGMYQSAPEGRHLSVNPALARIYGYDSPEELIASMTDIAKQLYVDPNRRVELFKHSEILNFESQVYRKDGSIIWILENTTAICDSKGNILYLVGTVEDITERKRTQEALRESEERFRNLADQAPVLIWMAGVKRHTYYFNRTWQTFTGRSTAQEYGQGWQQGVHPEDLPRVLAAYESAFASRSPFNIEYRLRHADGNYRWVLDTGAPRFASEQRFTGYIGSCVDISTRREAEQALRESEERFRTLYHKTPAMLQSIDAKGRLVGVSDFWLEAMGYEYNEVIGRPVSDFLFPQSPPGGGASSPSLLLNNGAIKNVSQQFVTKSGRVIDTLISAVAERDAEGNVQGSLAVIMDITDLKRAQDALRTQAQILDEIRDAVVASDLEARITSWNKGAERLYGYGADEVMGRHISFLYADPAALENDVVAPLLEHGTHASEVRLKRKSGEEFDAQIYLSCSYDGQGQRQGMIGYSLDITERKRAEQVQSVLARLSEAAATAESLEDFLSVVREQLAALFDAGHVFVALYDKDKLSYTVSAFADKFDAFSPTGQPGPRSMTDYVRRTGVPILADTELLEELKRSGEIELSGTPARQWMGVPLRTSRGVIGVMVTQSNRDDVVYTSRDLEIMTLISGNLAAVIERKRAANALIESEEQLRQSQKMEAIGRMAGGIAHDFNNLLTSILGHNEITLRGLPADHPLRDGIQEVAKAAERAAALTRQLLTFSRKQVLQPRVLDLNAIVTDMEKMLRRLIGEDIELLTRLQPDLGTIKADPSQIEQVLMNLVMNARDAMPAGGRLIIETANVEPDEIHDWRRKKAAPEPYVLLAVSDNGTGMDAETRSHIYEPFFTTKECSKGTGLGLSTVYGIVKQSGGHIWVYSEPGRGSVFRIYLPRVAEAAEELKPPEPNAPPNGQETILLVEDEDGVRDLVRRILVGKGYRVRAARLPAEALQLAELHHGAIDLLIADVIMPQLSGEELAQKVIALHPETKVLFISGSPHYSLGRFGVIEPGKTFLEKPFSAEALASHVRQLLDTLVTAS
jgi:PAS domain S-box-containing protein